MKRKNDYGYVNKFRPGYPLYNIECVPWPNSKKKDPDFLPNFLPALSDVRAIKQFEQLWAEWPEFYSWRLWRTSPKGLRKTLIARAK